MKNATKPNVLTSFPPFLLVVLVFVGFAFGCGEAGEPAGGATFVPVFPLPATNHSSNGSSAQEHLHGEPRGRLCCVTLNSSVFRGGSCALFSLLDLLLPLLLPLPLALLPVALHDLLVVVGEHGVILICQWDEDVAGGEATGNGVLETGAGTGRRR